MIYVKLLSALSICDTWPAFLVINSSYMDSHCGGSDNMLPTDGRGCNGLGGGLGSEKEADIVSRLSTEADMGFSVVY